MPQQLTQETLDLATAIQKASLDRGPMTYQELDLTWACKHVEQTITESFIPNRIANDRAALSKSEVRWIASVEAAREMLEAEKESTI